jgi:hypothetical protein
VHLDDNLEIDKAVVPLVVSRVLGLNRVLLPAFMTREVSVDSGVLAIARTCLLPKQGTNY